MTKNSDSNKPKSSKSKQKNQAQQRSADNLRANLRRRKKATKANKD